MRKLLILTSSFPRGQGDFAGSFVAEFAEALSTDNNIEILSPASNGARAEESFGKIRVHRFNYLWPKRAQLLDAAADLQPLLERSFIARLQVIPFLIIFFIRVLIMARRADVICSHWLVPAGLVGGLVARILKKPHIAIEHSGALHLLRKLRFGRLLARAVVRNSKMIVVVSEQMREQLSALCPEAAAKIHVVPMGVKNEVYRGEAYREEGKARKPEYKKRILFLGRLAPVKGVTVLIDALAGCSDLELIIAGDGEQRADLERRARSLELPVRFVGRVDREEKQRLLQETDLVVIPSIVLPDGRTEGMPVVCLEAFAAARAVIASSVGGLRELISDGESGFLFEPGNSAQLRELILLLLKDDERRMEIGNNARLVAAQYDWSIIASRFRALLNV
jgi:glycosyltransferase involved in cell wall biosynthesis